MVILPSPQQGFVDLFCREPDPSLRWKEIPVAAAVAPGVEMGAGTQAVTAKGVTGKGKPSPVKR